MTTCDHTLRFTFSKPGVRCTSAQCKAWRERVLDVLRAQRQWPAGASAELRKHPEVLEALTTLRSGLTAG